jgi:hypothetical protein
MKHMSVVVPQLKQERERAQKQVQRIDEALAALGGVSPNGASRTMSAAGRRKISLAQKARWAKHKAKPKRTILSSGAQENRGGAESEVGEGEERSLKEPGPGQGW